MKRITATYIISFLLLILFSACSISNHPLRKELRQYQKGILKDDTSFVYRLPYEEGKTHLLIQGYFSRYTHKNRAALDFKMKKGTKILAARGGVVIRLKEDGSRGGSHIKNRAHGNFVVIQHEDSSRTGYWHLQHNGVLVNVGDTVKQGQLIAISGNSGYTYFPHLHFIVWRPDKKGKWSQIGTRFQTSRGIRYLRPYRFYRNAEPTN